MGDRAAMAVANVSWVTSIGAAPSAHFFALALLICGLPTLAILASRQVRSASGPMPRYAVALGSILTIWSVPPAISVLADIAWQDAARALPLLERTIFALSIAIAGWAYLTADHRRGRRLSIAYPILLAASLLTLFFVTAWFWNTEYQAGASFNGSAYDTLWLLILCGLSAIGLLFCFIHVDKMHLVGGKLLFFGMLTLTQGIVLTLSLRGELPPGDFVTSARIGWLVAMMTFPPIVARSIFAWQVLRSRPTSTPGEIGPLTAEWTALQSVRGALAQAAAGELPQTILRAATLAIPAEFALLLRAPQTDDDNEAVYAEALAVFDTNEVRATPLIALPLAGLPKTAAALRLGKTLALNPVADARELTFLYRRLDVVGRGPALLTPLPRANAALLLAAPLAEQPFQESDREILRQFAALADDLLLQATGVGNLTLVLPELPTRDEALAHAREHILQLTAQLASLTSGLRQESEAAATPTPTSETAPLAWRVLLEEQQRESARLRIERDTLAERLAEWEEPLRVLGIEGGAFGLWQYLADEKEWAARARAEIEQLRRERNDWRRQVAERWRQFEADQQPTFTPGAPIQPQQFQRDALQDILPVIEMSVAGVAARLREKGVRVELAIAPRLPRVAGEDGLLRAALTAVVEQVVAAAPRQGKLQITAVPAQDRLRLEVSVSGARLISAGILSVARAQLEALGGELFHEANDAGDSAADEMYVLTLPTIVLDSETLGTRRGGAWRSAL